ncbi:MotA/TolQ/ExbB proton channel family protein [Methylobacterium oryzihabitans]|uniref:MotA/TolQ/ExbB proton channel domain-containing protein n=1 Tax=Methylobacterium oryzihabitans TaxID=2499852 RepID=A0A437NPP2_9HYPH|nr:MotA/TolQ/ExbB proton channel family protein [Methylobacterium oryzihabitans]RVU11982.1 hypothetical protein EOE48_28160 [Methylobacterium oryzihabitans]
MRPDPVVLAPPAGAEQHLRPRLSAYTAGLGLAFGLYLAVHGPGAGVAVWACAALVLAGLAAGLAGRGPLPSPWLRRAAAGSVALALAVPLAVAPAGPAAGAPLWPQILVALFASRVLAEESELRFSAFWRAPRAVPAPVALQSGGSAAALGAVLALVFYQLAGRAPAPGGTGFGEVLWGALTGDSALHRAIVVLFCVVLGHLVEAAARHRRDRAALAAFQAAAPGPDPAARAREVCGRYGRTWTEMLLTRTSTSGGGAAAEAFEAFRHASRRFVYGLVALLPLLGFLGTVVGLAAAMAALPLDGAAEGRVDLTGSLAGLALKFQTTLLGLVASLVASLLLAWLDKSETELAAACAVLAAAEARREP